MKLFENTQEITSVPELYFTDILRGPRYTIYIKKFPESSAIPLQKKYKKIIPASILRLYYHAYIPKQRQSSV
jgi:hypothetical protein